jgi:hypothetical protein
MAPEAMIVTGRAHLVADQLVRLMRDTGATVLNLRVHVPGLARDEVVEQIVALRDVLPEIRAGLQETLGSTL